MASDFSFPTLVARNLSFWQQWVDTQGVDALRSLDEERENLFNAVDHGLQYPDTSLHAAQLVLLLFPLIEHRGYWEEWLSIVKRAAAATDLPVEQLAQLYNQAGQLHQWLQQHPQAIALHQTTLTIAKQHKLYREQFSAHVQLSNSLYRSHNLETALVHAHHAKEITDHHHNLAPREHGALYNCFGLVALAHGRAIEAIPHFEQACRYFEQCEDVKAESVALNNLGITYEHLSQFTASRDSFDKAIRLLSATEFELEKVRVWLNKGAYYIKLEEFSLAEKCFRQANSCHLWRSPDYRHQSLVSTNLGYVLIELGRVQEAIVFLEKAITLWELINDQLFLGNALYELGRAFLKDGQFDNSTQSLSKAILSLTECPQTAWSKTLLDEATALHKESQKWSDEL